MRALINQRSRREANSRSGGGAAQVEQSVGVTTISKPCHLDWLSSDGRTELDNVSPWAIVAVAVMWCIGVVARGVVGRMVGSLQLAVDLLLGEFVPSWCGFGGPLWARWSWGPGLLCLWELRFRHDPGLAQPRCKCWGCLSVSTPGGKGTSSWVQGLVAPMGYRHLDLGV
ncbi:hypothetical protein AMECASPLE_018211 [Ameca splendens]|uniref:Uncharacterized protein n=1 Tax=Ameca splendens TaxID=208324 RepID=A0ABV0Y2Q1_9TELE